jgi:hypothetical protein
MRPVSCALAALVIATPVIAQSPSAAEPARHSVWMVYGGDHSVSNRIGVVFDSHLRLTADGDRTRQLLLRPGVSLALTDRVKVSGGYTLMAARDDANDPLTPKRSEHRAWASAQLAHDLGHLGLAHRVRAEHRWLPGVRVDQAGAPAGETYVTAERLRYNLRATIPLAGTAAARWLTASVSEEVFASFGGYAGDMAVDQNRAAVSIGVRLGRALRMDVGYMLQSSADDDGRFTERNHVLQLTAISTARLR